MSTEKENSAAVGDQVERRVRVSKRQRDILRYALGWPKCFRNYFCTGEGSDDFPDCEALVEAGMMARHTRDGLPDYIYTVTDLGRAAVDG